jgi:hypothetical protein
VIKHIREAIISFVHEFVFMLIAKHLVLFLVIFAIRLPGLVGMIKIKLYEDIC